MAGSCHQKLRSYYQITAMPRYPEEEEEKEKEQQQQKREMRLFENIFSLDFFLTFRLSYSIYSIITGSRTQQVSFMENVCVKAGISCRFILY